MDPRTELQRIEVNNQLDSLPANPWRFDVDASADSEESMRRLLDFMATLAKHSQQDWPSDEEWDVSLPAWLLAAIPRLSKEETDKLLVEIPREQWDSIPWERMSWLDALRDRGWRWWGWEQRDGRISIVLHIASYPERIDAFRELLRATGIRVVSENYSAQERR